MAQRTGYFIVFLVVLTDVENRARFVNPDSGFTHQSQLPSSEAAAIVYLRFECDSGAHTSAGITTAAPIATPVLFHWTPSDSRAEWNRLSLRAAWPGHNSDDLVNLSSR